MTVKLINDSVEPDELVPTLLAFEALLGLAFPVYPTAPLTFRRVTALGKRNLCYDNTTCIETNTKSFGN